MSKGERFPWLSHRTVREVDLTKYLRRLEVEDGV